MTRRPCLFPSIVRALRAAHVFLLLLAAAVPAELRAQVASQSVNMVSGIQWPGGDPFLQRQNEPSIAMSSRNPRHLLAGANDYRTVDIPFPPSPANTPPETGDAWLGVFKSFDGGLTWKSTLLPGYPQQPGGPVGPLAGFTTAADPVVRAGTNGLFYYSGIAFNRGTNLGVLFVSRFMDLNNKENGDPVLNQDPIRYIDTQIVDRAPAASSPFIDKPWIAVDKPRLLDGVCNLTVPQPQPGNPNATVRQTVPAGSVYAAWTEATGTGSALTTNIFFSYSRDCGGSWSRPVMVNGANKVNQGASIAIDPVTGVINVVWRRFASGSQTDALMIARSLRGLLFSTPSVVASLPPYNAATLLTGKSFFDQGTSTDSFRTNAYPTIGIDRRPDAGTEDTDEPDNPTFRGRIFVAWSQRMPPNGDARVVLSVSTDGASTWSAPQPIDNSSLTDDSGTSFSRGHQFMPQMTVTADKITAIYYDARLDHTFGLFAPRTNPLTPDPATGKLYLETRALRGELLDPGGAARVFTPFFVETGMTEWRHTLDLRVAQADSAVSPAFTSARLSQYIFGTRGDETGTVTALQQLQINPPNLRLFQQGTVPFLGDYIDVAGLTFLPPRAPGLRWRFNSLPGTSPVFLASWTSNQDVRPPLDGDWTHYTPAASTGGSSVFNSSVPRPPCQQGQEGMRNQNIYAARISQGLAVSSVQNAKPLSPTLQRDLTVNLENLTPLSRTFRLTVASQPVGGRASFVPAPNPVPNPFPAATTTLDVVIPANSSVARSVYALSTNPNALVEVDVAELNGPPGSPLKAHGLTGFVIFNTDPSAPTLVNPDNTTTPSVTTVEVYNPNVSNPNVSNPNVSNPNVSNPNVSNPNVSNLGVSNPNVSNADLANPNVSNTDVSNPNVSNPNVSNPNVSNPNVSNAPVSDATYTVTNSGNTAATYHVQLAGTAPAGTPIQLIITKPYASPASLNCVLFEQQHNIPVASVVNPTFVDPNLPPNPAITDPSDGNATFVLAPGESILVTIRGPVDVPTLTNIIQNVAPVIVAHAANTNDPTNKPATSPPAITTSALPDGVATHPYSATLTALGGTRPYVAWAATGLPANLSISGSTTGLISGTPAAAGTFSVGVSVTDSAPKTGNRAYTVRIANPLVITTAALPNGFLGTAYSQTLAATGGLGTRIWTVVGGALPLGIGLSASGVLSGIPVATGTSAFTVQVTDSASPAQTTTRALSLTILSASVGVSGPPSDLVGGQVFSLTVHVEDNTAAPIPGALITLSFGVTGCPTAVLSGTTSATTNVTGNAIFPNLSIDRGGPGFSINASASAPGYGVLVGSTTPFVVEGFCSTGGLSAPRKWHSATRLTNGKVLVAGGFDGTTALASAELYDPATRSFTPTGGMGTARVLHSAALLHNGKVLIVGGGSDFGVGAFTDAELYDPATGTFSYTGSLSSNTRQMRVANVLNDGRVLLSGGFVSTPEPFGTGTADLYDPSGGTFTPTGNMTHDRGEYTATLLGDGRVFLSGGYRNNVGGSVADAETYAPVAAGAFTGTPGSMAVGRALHTAAVLLDGRVLLAGGENDVTFTPTTDLFDPSGSGTISPAATMSVGRRAHSATLLPSGRILEAGGQTLIGSTPTVIGSAERFDAVSGFAPTGALNVSRQFHTATPLLDGTVLVAGGEGAGGTALASGELYFSGLSTTTTALPTGFQGHPYPATPLLAIGIPPFTWTPAAPLPAGFTLSASGILSGTPSGSGATSVSVQVADATGAASTRTYPVFLVGPSATNGVVTISNVSVSGGGSEATMAGGVSFSVGFDYTITDDACPGCIDQIEVGFADGLYQACAYNGIPGVTPGVSGSATVALTAPSTPGRYYIGFDRAQTFFCHQYPNWWNGAPGPNRYIGVVTVP